MDNILSQAIRERDEFLENHPHLLDTQKSIDRVLEHKKAVQRFHTMLRLLIFSVNELNAECQLLKEDIRSLDENVSKFKRKNTY